MKTRFLIIRFSSIGDIVLTTPVVRCLKKQFPEAEIHFLTKPAYRILLENNPYIDRIWLWEGKTGAVLESLKSLHFTRIIDLHHNLRSLRVKWALRRPSSSFRKLNPGKYLLVRLKWNILPKQHLVDRYMETVSPLGVENDGLGLDYFLPQGVEENVLNTLPSTHRNGFIAVVCGALKGTKRMPEEMLAHLCKGIPYPIVLLGGPAEAEIGKKIEMQAGSNTWNACGLFSLHESAACIHKADVVISHDTGLMHIAAAFQKPILSIWGNTVPEFGMTPYLTTNPSQSYLAEVKGLSCRPCSKIGFETCPKKHFKCMRNQDLDLIAQKVRELASLS